MLIGGCVNVTSGALVFDEVDAQPAGPEEIKIHRNYLSQHLWSFFPQTMVLIGGSTEKPGYSKEGRLYAYTKAVCGEESGSIIAYFGWIADGQTGQLQSVSYGLSNCSQGEMGGKTNVKNNKLWLKEKYIEVITGNGSKRTYTKVDGGLDSLTPNILDRPLFRLLGSSLNNPDLYLLQSEIRPNGNKAIYTYDQRGLLTEIRVVNATEQNLLSFVRLNYFLDEAPARITMQTSSGHEVVYLFGQDGQLGEVRTKEGWCQYQYSEDGLVHESCSDASIRKIQYNSSHVVQSYSTLQDHFEFSFNLSGKPATTNVLDRQGNKTRYTHTGQRLQSIDVCDAAGNLQRTKKKFWGKGPEAGNLISEVVADSQGQNVMCTTYSYDSNHNVEKERLYGNLQGAQTPPIQLDENGLPIENSAIPCHMRKRQYSDDGFNLLVLQGEPKNGSVRYEYKPGTNCMAAKLVYDTNGMKKRTYFEYDENSFLICQTTDDATGENKNAPFSEKHITKIVPSKDFPTGLPLIIEEKYYDRDSKQECSLRKDLTTYGTCGRIVLEEVEGKDGTKKRIA
jgi:YD repeat-containing protein